MIKHCRFSPWLPNWDWARNPSLFPLSKSGEESILPLFHHEYCLRRHRWKEPDHQGLQGARQGDLQQLQITYSVGDLGTISQSHLTPPPDTPYTPARPANFLSNLGADFCALDENIPVWRFGSMSRRGRRWEQKVSDCFDGQTEGFFSYATHSVPPSYCCPLLSIPIRIQFIAHFFPLFFSMIPNSGGQCRAICGDGTRGKIMERKI